MIQATAADHLKHGSHGAVGDSASDVARVDALLLPQLELAVEVRVALDQVVVKRQLVWPSGRQSEGRSCVGASIGRLGSERQLDGLGAGRCAFWGFERQLEGARFHGQGGEQW